MDGMYQYVNKQTNKTQSLEQFFDDLKDEEYDTDALKEDVPCSKRGDDEESNVANMASGKGLYKFVQEYMYYDKCL